jgi:hypothetical protein
MADTLFANPLRAKIGRSVNRGNIYQLLLRNHEVRPYYQCDRPGYAHPQGLTPLQGANHVQ